MPNENLITILYPSDRVPAMVIKRTANTLTCKMLKVDNLPVAYHSGPFPVFDYEFTEDEAKQRAYGNSFKVYKTRKGWQYASCCPVLIGKAVYFRDHSD